MLFGSIAFDDLAPGYGDLDFIALLSDALSDTDARRLIKLREPFRSDYLGVLARMIEGSFLPLNMLEPGTSGKAVWWGTSGERVLDKNEHEALDMKVIQEKGIVIYGEDLRHMFPEIGDADCIIAIKKYQDAMQIRWRPGRLHSIDWLLTCARLIYWLREGRLSSKSEAAGWGHMNLKGDWRRELPKAKELRLHPDRYEMQVVKSWVDSLGDVVKEAAKELGEEISIFKHTTD
jgi:hypothetical protein